MSSLTNDEKTLQFVEEMKTAEVPMVTVEPAQKRNTKTFNPTHTTVYDHAENI